MNKQHIINTTGYLSRLFQPKGLINILSHTVRAIEESQLKYDAIAFCGVSGALIAPSCCVMLDKYPFVVRKQMHEGHSHQEFEGINGDFNYIIVDDLTVSGNTVDRIVNVVHRRGGKFVGAFFYNQDCESTKPKRQLAAPMYFYWKGKWEMCPAGEVPVPEPGPDPFFEELRKVLNFSEPSNIYGNP